MHRLFKDWSTPHNVNSIVDAKSEFEICKDNAQEARSTTLCEFVGSGKTPKERYGAVKNLPKSDMITKYCLSFRKMEQLFLMN